MQDFQDLGQPDYLSRSELELQLARLALVVMRAAPEAFENLGGPSPLADQLAEGPGDVAAHLLRRARPEHRPFVEARLLELSRCLAGTRSPADTHDWLSVTLPAPGVGTVGAANACAQTYHNGSARPPA